MSTHSARKDFTCVECDKSFRSTNDLKRHQFIHSGEKPFKCNVCGKSFNRRGNCTVHEKSHFNKVIEFKCDTCNKVFDRLKKYNVRFIIYCSHLELFLFIFSVNLVESVKPFFFRDTFEKPIQKIRRRMSRPSPSN